MYCIPNPERQRGMTHHPDLDQGHPDQDQADTPARRDQSQHSKPSRPSQEHDSAGRTSDAQNNDDPGSAPESGDKEP